VKHPRLLVVTAVAAERAAVQRGLSGQDVGHERILVVESGVGVANAAVATAEALHHHPEVRAVICAGIAGGFVSAGTTAPVPGVPVDVRGHTPAVAIGGLAVARSCVAADLGADSPEGFLSLDQLGFGSSTVECDGRLVDTLLAALPDAAAGSVLTVATVTGTAARAAQLHARHPDAVAEAMEGFGVATAARRAGIPVAEVRSISNVVGPRDRSSWRIGDALAALERLGPALLDLAG